MVYDRSTPARRQYISNLFLYIDIYSERKRIDVSIKISKLTLTKLSHQKRNAARFNDASAACLRSFCCGEKKIIFFFLPPLLPYQYCCILSRLFRHTARKRRMQKQTKREVESSQADETSQRERARRRGVDRTPASLLLLGGERGVPRHRRIMPLLISPNTAAPVDACNKRHGKRSSERVTNFSLARRNHVLRSSLPTTHVPTRKCFSTALSQKYTFFF